MRKNRENETKIEHLRMRLSAASGLCGGGGGGMTSIRDNIGSAQQFVTESLPYIRIVIPQGTDVPVSCADSIVFNYPTYIDSFLYANTDGPLHLSFLFLNIRCQFRTGQLAFLRHGFQ
jgi:hypothetical protein